MTIMAILALFAPFLPDLLGLAKSHLDHKHELEMMGLRMQQAASEAQWRMEEIEVQGQVQEMLAVRKPHESYGVKLLEAADKSDSKIWGWSFNTVFIMFAVLDWMISSVRTIITYWAFGLYCVHKLVTLLYVYTASAKYSSGMIEALSKTLTNGDAWTSFDQEMLMMILCFWFGSRIRREARGIERK